VPVDDKNEFLRLLLKREKEDSPEVVDTVKINDRRSLDFKKRLEESRLYDIEDALSTHNRITELLATASKSLAEASILSEGLQRKTQTNRFYKEINLSRLFRMNEILRVVNIARHQVSKAHKISLITNKDVQNSVDDLIRSDFRASFE